MTAAELEAAVREAERQVVAARIEHNERPDDPAAFGQYRDALLRLATLRRALIIAVARRQTQWMP